MDWLIEIVLLLLITVSCTGKKVGEEVKAPLIRREPSALIQSLNKQTVALVSVGDDGIIVPYCSGVWLNKKKILTANHCIDTAGVMYIEYQKIGVGDNPKEVYFGKAGKKDLKNDLIIIEAMGNVGDGEVVKMGDVEPGIGEKVEIIGHPKELYWTYLEGVVGQYWDHFEFEDGDEREGLMEVIAPIYFGNSGGGIFDKDGKLVGIVSFMSERPNTEFGPELAKIKEFVKGE